MIFFIIGSVIPALVLALALFCYKNYNYLTDPLKIFSLYLVCVFLIEVASKILWFYEINNLGLLHLLTMLEIILLLGFQIRSVENPVIKNAAKIAMILGVAMVLVDAIYINGILHFNSLSYSFSKIVLIIFSIIYLFNKYEVERRDKNENLLINYGIIFYASTSIILFSVGNILLEIEWAEQMILWVLNLVFYLIFLTLAFLNIRKVVYSR